MNKTWPTWRNGIDREGVRAMVFVRGHRLETGATARICATARNGVAAQSSRWRRIAATDQSCELNGNKEVDHGG